MPQNKIYKNWKVVTEADFVSLFIKTCVLRWLAVVGVSFATVTSAVLSVHTASIVTRTE